MARRIRKRDVVFASVKLLFALVLVAVLLWLGGFVWFVGGLQTTPEAPQAQTDGIVVLTGGPYRINLAVSLLSEGLGERLLITGIYGELDDETLRRANAIPKDIFDCCIDLGRGAANTKGNADEAAIWVAAHGYRSLRIVTTFDHMPRSLAEFHRAMPGIQLIAHPVSPDTVGPEVRWPSAGRLALEYTKYWAALLRSRAGTGAGVLRPTADFT
ncbi:YdcF family protein [Govanella unica]|uniref:YdcF family protein n=1 Tax=Govanella unica TaxID=2975056 RepID=A0A9X3Z634_9PROT|nr:YdcF family protein [Govania unica]MDA5192603.1 YdcF family protein [Govania unica]